MSERIAFSDKRWACPHCQYSVAPEMVLTERKHFDAHSLKCVRCLYQTETKATWLEAEDAYRGAAQRPADCGAWMPISTAPKDGTPVLVQLKNPLPVEGRSDLERWHGLAFVARHCGLEKDGFDIGWQFAAPVGHGGFPDAWIAGWQPISPMTSTDHPTAKD